MFALLLGHRATSLTGVLAACCLFLASLSLLSCGTSSRTDDSSGNLLAGKQPSAQRGVARAARLTDGVMAVEGDYWQTNLTAGLSGGASFVQFDLGAPTSLCCITLQGDANDTYVVSISQDGVEFEPLWEAGPARGSGMQTRSVEGKAATARHIKVTAKGGDSSYSLSELAIFSERPTRWPPSFERKKGARAGESVRTRMVLFAVVSILFLLLNTRTAPRWTQLLVVVPLGAFIYLGIHLYELWPISEDEQTMLRAVVAAIAGVAAFRIYLPGRTEVRPSEVRPSSPSLPPRGKGEVATFALLAVLAVGCYYHFGDPQFTDASKERKTLVHLWDMRVYFPVAKYFNELNFDGLYLGSLAAYLDNNPRATPSSIGNVRLRDLTNNEMKTASEMMPQIQAVRTRFTAERWEEFRIDMKYFQDAMGTGGYLSSLRDHGGNATPVWLLPAHVLFRWAPANELTLSLTALLDPVMLALMFYAIARTFGVRTALICIIVFGVTDFSRLGTNLMGSTLRFDWLVALGLGACALKKQRWMLGGALIAYSGLIRAFPALAAFFLVVPALWWLFDIWREHKRLPSTAEIRERQRPLLMTAAGVVVCVVGLFVVTSAVFGYKASWGEWFQKISIHADKPNTNHVGLRNVLSYEPQHIAEKVFRRDHPEPWVDWQVYQIAAFERRKPLYYGGILLFAGLAIAASRKRRLEQAALMGLMLVPVLFYPANYYLHFIFLLPIIATRDRPPHGRLFGWVSLVLFAMSVAQYFSLSGGWSDVVYTLQSDILLLGFAALLIPMAWTAWRGLDAPTGPTIPV